MSKLVVGTQYKVTTDNPNLKNPDTIRKNMVVEESYVKSLKETLENDPKFLLRFDIDEEATRKFNKVAELPPLDEIGYDASSIKKEKTWNQVVKEMNAANSIEQLRNVLRENNHLTDSKAVTKAYETNIKRLSDEN